VREQRIRLEHHVHVALVRRDTGDVVTVQEDIAFCRLVESGDHPQGGRLAAAGGTQQREELAFDDLHVNVLDRRYHLAARGERLRQTDEFDGGKHARPYRRRGVLDLRH